MPEVTGTIPAERLLTAAFAPVPALPGVARETVQESSLPKSFFVRVPTNPFAKPEVAPKFVEVDVKATDSPAPVREGAVLSPSPWVPLLLRHRTVVKNDVSYIKTSALEFVSLVTIFEPVD